MITKVTPKLTPIVQKPIRANLQKAAVAGLAVLAGSSMSGGYIRPSVSKDMIIPGGMDFLKKRLTIF